MTMPYERTRSVIQTRDFLVELSRDPRVPEPLRSEARRLLRHYPSKSDLFMAGMLEQQKAGNPVLQPVFSSTIDG